MYKLGPIHQGIMERGSKTASDSYILWPAKVGAFSLVMGRHVSHQDTSDLPFSYLIEQQSTSYIMPGANLKSVGTIRDARKWPSRDARKDPDKMDCINYNLLSPYTIQKMLRGRDILLNLQKVSGETSDTYTYQSGKIKSSSLRNGLKYYGLAIDKFLGNSLISRLMSSEFASVSQMREALAPTAAYGEGDWVDLAGLIAPKTAVQDLLDAIESGSLHDVSSLNHCFADIHSEYYDYEWNWAYKVIEENYGVNLSEILPEKLEELIIRWRSSVIALDNLIYEDARKEFSLSAMTSFGADGDELQRMQDFEQVRGARFESDPFVKSVRDHIRIKTELADEVLSKLRGIS
jgi:hypothetical protein